MNSSNLDELCINAIRILSAEAVQKAGSGHPGLPMGAASIAYVLWDRILKYNPADPDWFDRDRFILSAGHGSMLLYSLLYLTGYDISLDDIKQFRQWKSKTPGHPEYGLTPGVEVTTGPLGQGCANGVGMAIAERRLATLYNRPNHEIINHYTYVLVSDGDIQEGISSEAASLAGTLHLNKLIYLYDCNGIQQDGVTRVSFTENVHSRFLAYGWNVIGPINSQDLMAIDWAIRQAHIKTARPTLIIFKTTIGYGSPNKSGTNLAHGEPLGEKELELTKQNLGWNFPEPFTVPPEVLSHFRKALERGKLLQERWQYEFEDYKRVYPVDASQLMRDLSKEVQVDWDNCYAEIFQDELKPMSTRDASGKTINWLAGKVNSLIGGAADLAESTRTVLKNYPDYSSICYSGRNLRYGLREHAMAAISNGLALHGGVIPFAASFLIFSDYMRPALRLAALMGIRVIFVFTHDSIALGEDGPTHQPIEHIMSLRMIPNMVVLRPADATETLEAWKIAVNREAGPTALVLTRQRVNLLDRKLLAPASGVSKGGYVLWESGGTPEVILIGTGSEVHLALEAGVILKNLKIQSRVVSLPSWELFEMQTEEYRESVLPHRIKARVSIEAGNPLGWERYTGTEGRAIGISRFGVSAPGDIVYKNLGFTSQHIVDEALKLL